MIDEIKSLAMLKMEKNFIAVIKKKYSRYPYFDYKFEKLLECLQKEVDELKNAYKNCDINNMREEIADISNFCDYLYEICINGRVIP